MNTSIVIAQVSGICFAVMGLSMLFNKKWTAGAVEKMTENQGVLWLAGLIALMMGTVMVVFNNEWTSGLPLFITILGWLALIKGAVILIFPNATVSYYKKMNTGNIFTWGGLVVLIIAVILLYYGFM